MNKSDNQEMLMDWEKQMLMEITTRVNDEINRKKNNQSIRPRVIVSDLTYELERKKKIKEEFSKCREQYTLNILEKCGLNMTDFMNSSLFNSPRTSLMLAHIQGKIDGYDLYLTDHSNKDGSFTFNDPKRKPNGHPIDINRMLCYFVNDTLIIESDEVRYEYNKDEHCLIYLNGKVVATHKKVMTDKEEYEDIKNLMEDMRSDRLQSERKKEKSRQYAKTWRVEE